MTASTNRIAGQAFIYVEGNNLKVAGALKYAVNIVKRETKAGQSGVDGYSEMPTAPFIDLQVRDDGSLSMSDIANWTGVTVTCKLINGKVITGAGMWTVESQEVDTTEGSFNIRFEGKLVTEAPA